MPVLWHGAPVGCCWNAVKAFALHLSTFFGLIVLMGLHVVYIVFVGQSDRE